MERKKKLASVIATAVTAYMQLEETVAPGRQAFRERPLANTWGISARQDAMQMRKLLQLRITGR